MKQWMRKVEKRVVMELELVKPFEMAKVNPKDLKGPAFQWLSHSRSAMEEIQTLGTLRKLVNQLD